MPFGYYNVERSRYRKESIHGMSLVKAAWTNGYYALVCNSAERRDPNEWEPDGRKFPAGRASSARGDGSSSLWIGLATANP
jgi:hypothetical protein